MKKKEEEPSAAQKLITKAGAGTAIGDSTERNVNYLMSPMTRKGHSVPDRGRRSLNSRGMTPAQALDRRQREIDYSARTGTGTRDKLFGGGGYQTPTTNRQPAVTRNSANGVSPELRRAGRAVRMSPKAMGITGQGKIGRGQEGQEWKVTTDEYGIPTTRALPDGTTQMFDEATGVWGKQFGGLPEAGNPRPVSPITQMPGGMFTNQGGGTDINRNGAPARDKIVLPGQNGSTFDQKMAGLDSLRFQKMAGLDAVRLPRQGGEGGTGQGNNNTYNPGPLNPPTKKVKKSSKNSSTYQLDPMQALLMRITNSAAKDYATVKNF